MNLEELYVILDGVRYSREEIEMPKFGIYEVMRLHYRGPLFFEEHMARLNHSLGLKPSPFSITETEVKENICALIEHNGNLDANITVYVTGDAASHHIYTYYSKTVSTPAQAYEEGVYLKTARFERENPGSKNFTGDMKSLRDRLAADDCYDYVLVDDDGKIREASRSNLFFFKGDCVYTASDEKVLSGITRKKVLVLLPEMARLEFREIGKEELPEMDGAFLSGTSPGIVPIAKIDNVCYDMSRNQLARTLMGAYETLIEDYYESLQFFAPYRRKLFQRQIPLFTEEGDRRLSSARVMIVGLGGVGAAAAEAIARCGVGEVILVDYDAVEYSNINRQLFASYDKVGKPKIEAAKERLRLVNPFLRIETLNFRLEEDNTDVLAAFRPDYIVDAIDSFGAKIALILWAAEHRIRLISSCGMASKLDPTKLKLADIYKTSVCPLAKKMRRVLKEKGLKHLDVVYSTEEREIIKTEDGALASVSFVPPQAGLMMASKVINALALADRSKEEVWQNTK